MSFYVVDTNVPKVANGKSEQASAHCTLACIRALQDIIEHGIILLDEGSLILAEYMGNLSMSGQPGPGDAFMKWVWDNQGKADRCRRVKLTPKPDGPDSFAEFPDDPELKRFDRSDRKFVAVALASGKKPEILNAVDPDWQECLASLERHGVRVRFLCPKDLARLRSHR